jgi:hypothetical protein
LSGPGWAHGAVAAREYPQWQDPFTVVSLDFIKSDRRRDDFLRACPELVIVDEAHTCSQHEGGGRNQRHLVLRGLAQDPRRHLILVTATPHSGKEDAFRSLLSLLSPELGQLPRDGEPDADDAPQQDVQAERRVYRRKLAAHFVQRRRGDIADYLKEETPFPRRLERYEAYTLAPEYKRLFARVLGYARETIRTEQGRRQRLSWWSALALLRAMASSPAAACAALRNRAPFNEASSAEQADEIGQCFRWTCWASMYIFLPEGAWRAKSENLQPSTSRAPSYLWICSGASRSRSVAYLG